MDLVIAESSKKGCLIWQFSSKLRNKAKRPELEPGLQFILGYYGRPDMSALVQLLEAEGRKLGAAVLLAKGRKKFSEEHARLFSLLNKPFDLAGDFRMND